MADKISTTALAKQKNSDAKSLFSELARLGYITRSEDKWLLTSIGEKFGGEYKEHAEFGSFIVWPINLIIDTSISAGIHLTATQIGERLGLNAKKINQILNELGWIDKRQDGWHITELGLRAGGQQRENKEAASLYIVWHDTIMRNNNFRRSVSEFLGSNSDAHATDKSFSHFQQKFAAKYRTSDGHYVRSKGELLIDNWLYMAGLVHAYERKLPIEEDVYSNFYLPSGRVYIQFWGSDTGTTSEYKKTQIRAVFEKYHFNLIELDQNDADNLDNILPKALRQFAIKAY